MVPLLIPKLTFHKKMKTSSNILKLWKTKKKKKKKPLVWSKLYFTNKERKKQKCSERSESSLVVRTEWKSRSTALRTALSMIQGVVTWSSKKRCHQENSTWSGMSQQRQQDLKDRCARDKWSRSFKCQALLPQPPCPAPQGREQACHGDGAGQGPSRGTLTFCYSPPHTLSSAPHAHMQTPAPRGQAEMQETCGLESHRLLG